MSDLLAALSQSGLFTEQHFEDENLQDALVDDVSFIRCQFSACNFDYATIQRSNFIHCRFENCSLKEAVFEDCRFCEGEDGTLWRYSDLSKAAFRRANLSLNQFIGCQAYKLTLDECAAQGAKFNLDVHRKIASKTIHGGLHVDRCKMQYADFSGGDLAESRLESSDLRDADFSGCDLSNASLRGSALNNTDFSQCILDGANLTYSTFDEIDFSATASHHRVIISRDQHETVLASMGILTRD